MLELKKDPNFSNVDQPVEIGWWKRTYGDKKLLKIEDRVEFDKYNIEKKSKRKSKKIRSDLNDKDFS